MRLIDADKIDNFSATADDGKRYVILPIEKLGDIPTAYDVDKVVSLMEAKKNRIYAEMFGRRNGKSIRAGYIQGCQDAIDIVKRGGTGDYETDDWEEIMTAAIEALEKQTEPMHWRICENWYYCMYEKAGGVNDDR